MGAPLLIAAAAAILLLLGSLHLLFTFVGPKLRPRDPALQERMQAVAPGISASSTMWDFWVGFKLWGAIPLTMIFAIANVPMLMRHGLQAGNIPDTIPPQE
jgi:intracellular septation protein